ncbi:serine/threonine-protein phosphatase 6 regulatory ankyrin repeat subunit A-like [Phymastichus coffea]|uniref:serine/threonine-protein phosphatase 6 regulatory ankyrin repeat subunit A-like n=1 Tax=Phymastichus coffea TaxID=108790 RepID=UPI00273B4305|nr:serine/threonine-protein phosphatase 6 regulatory ankyrin repeat subunit A-like [Phymastichus coffea]
MLAVNRADADRHLPHRFNKYLLDCISYGQYDLVIGAVNDHSCRKCDDWGTLLHYAVLFDQHHIARELIRRGSDIESQTVILRQTPLIIALEMKSTQSALLLLNSGANVFVKDINSVSALRLAFDQALYHYDIISTILYRLKVKQEIFVEMNIRRFKEAEVPLYYLACMRENRQLVYRVLEEGASVNNRTVCNRTALFAAVMCEDAPLVEHLLNNGASINISDCYGKWPLTIAASNGYPDVMKLLLERGANPNVLDRELGLAALAIVLTDERRRRASHQVECIEMLLFHKAQLEGSNTETVIDMVVRNGDKEKMYLVLSELAKMSLSGHGQTAERLLNCNLPNEMRRLEVDHDYYESCKVILSQRVHLTDELTFVQLLNYSMHQMRIYARTLNFHTKMINLQERISETNYPLYVNDLTMSTGLALKYVRYENAAYPMFRLIVSTNFRGNNQAVDFLTITIIQFLDIPALRVLAEMLEVHREIPIPMNLE